MKFIARKPGPFQFSLERLREGFFAKYFDFEVVEAPCASAGLIGKLRILLWAFRFRDSRVHLLGDVHFLTWVLKKGWYSQTVHDVEVVQRSKGLKRWILSEIWFKGAINRSAITICISEQTKRSILKEISGVNPQKLCVIHNPFIARTSKSGLVSKEFDVITIGSKSNKNLRWLASAIEDTGVRWLAVGQEMEILQEVQGKNVNLTIKEKLSDEELVLMFQSSKLLVMASESEGFGVPILEAQFLGIPVVCSDIPVFREVAGKGAYFVPLNSRNQLKSTIIDVLTGENKPSDVVQLGLRNLQRFQPEFIASEYNRALKRLTSLS